MRVVATFSIVASDPDTEALGVAVQSKFLAVGAVVPWARAGIGAVATQALANYNYGLRGLELMGRGATARETVEALISSDDEREHRQLGVVDAAGRAATFTGGECFEWAGGITGEHYAAQGNILVGRETVEGRWPGPSRTRAESSPGGSWRRWTPGRGRGATRAASSRRRCSS